MSANATTDPKRAMDCDKAAPEEVLEGYLAGGLSDADRDAFEAHCFECAGCFDELRTIHAIREELARTRADIDAQTTRPFVAWGSVAALAATVVLAVGLALWTRPLPTSPESAPTNAQPPPRAQLPETQQAARPPQTVAPEPSLEQLARVDPPRYEPLTFRRVPDEATARFLEGMEQYRKGDYEGALLDLRAAAELDPDAAHARFFLGISQLMLRRDEAGIDQLQATIALGDSAYLEEAHLYRAKAFLRRRDFRAAETELKKLVALRGSQSGEARRLLTELEKLKNRSP